MKLYKSMEFITFLRYISTTQRGLNSISKIKLYKNINVNSKKHDFIENQDMVENEVKIQMISHNLYKQIFGNAISRCTGNLIASQNYIAELNRHGIKVNAAEHIPDVQIKLPPLRGGNIIEHFHSIAKEQIELYEKILLSLIQLKQLPIRPKQWEYKKGWTMYDTENDKTHTIEYPKENGLVFDVEVCVSDGAAPVLCTAVGRKYWYSWASPRLFHSEDEGNNVQMKRDGYRYTLDDLIPMGYESPKLLVGHNVSYDRARLREQYLLKDTKTRFVDTMSLHVSVSGITSYQRALLKSNKAVSLEDSEWMEKSSLNSLAEVYNLYCGINSLDKQLCKVFVEGDLQDVRNDFQSLMNYCSNDVIATYNVLCVVFPIFQDRFPHPATLAGMMEINSAYLPVNSNWLRYIEESNLAFEDFNIESKYHLSRQADDACALLHNEKYTQNLWLWDEDWSLQELKLKKNKIKNVQSVTNKCHKNAKIHIEDKSTVQKGMNEELLLKEKFQHLYEKRKQLPARRPLLPGYPAWYRKLCNKPPKSTNADNSFWIPGATEISTSMHIAPKLLSLSWEGYPLHYIREHGWGFLVPFRNKSPLSKDTVCRIPIEELTEFCHIPEFIKCYSKSDVEYTLGNLYRDLDINWGKRIFNNALRKDHTNGTYTGSGVWCNQILQDCCFFLKLPHKDGRSFRVGNPLSRDFINKFSDNVLTCGDKESVSATRIIEIARMMSYWRNNRDRIMNQFVVWLPNQSDLLENTESMSGAICPQIVSCGTLTRRAMEPTWLTASNAQRDRIGSELRSMVQAPPNYKIIGADVDSQELWIASILGDAYAHGIHGVTPLGWMTLSGSKKNDTDMHSVTAKAIGISRDHAKVINYARIYGAGQNFAEGLLKQFNPTLSEKEAKSKALKMFSITKGKRIYRLLDEFKEEYTDRSYTGTEAFEIASSCNKTVGELFHKPCWEGGTESAMFNSLEEIALQDKPVTPFLGCRLSRALQTNGVNDNRFLPTKINWVVQSGAVDFLHLMLVAMRWLMADNVRFCLSFHDEVRYLVREEKAYQAALAMHVTNLLTRSYCSARIGLFDLPMSVAFFSSVEVDTVLRKDAKMDCKTPSNPHGLEIGYGIRPGESMNIYNAIEKAGGGDLRNWNWIK